MSVINDFYPIDKLKPLNGLCDDFHTETKKLQRPYFPISVRSYHALFNTITRCLVEMGV